MPSLVLLRSYVLIIDFHLTLNFRIDRGEEEEEEKAEEKETSTFLFRK